MQWLKRVLACACFVVGVLVTGAASATADESGVDLTANASADVGVDLGLSNDPCGDCGGTTVGIGGDAQAAVGGSVDLGALGGCGCSGTGLIDGALNLAADIGGDVLIQLDLLQPCGCPSDEGSVETTGDGGSVDGGGTGNDGTAPGPGPAPGPTEDGGGKGKVGAGSAGPGAGGSGGKGKGGAVAEDQGKDDDDEGDPGDTDQVDVGGAGGNRNDGDTTGKDGGGQDGGGQDDGGIGKFGNGGVGSFAIGDAGCVAGCAITDGCIGCPDLLDLLINLSLTGCASHLTLAIHEGLTLDGACGLLVFGQVGLPGVGTVSVTADVLGALGLGAGPLLDPCGTCAGATLLDAGLVVSANANAGLDVGLGSASVSVNAGVSSSASAGLDAEVVGSATANANAGLVGSATAGLHAAVDASIDAGGNISPGDPCGTCDGSALGADLGVSADVDAGVGAAVTDGCGGDLLGVTGGIDVGGTVTLG